MKIASFFSGIGGLDLGFEQAGFETVWANEVEPDAARTYRHNFPNAILDSRSIIEISPGTIPAVDGIIGGPPCQSWSVAGAHRGDSDPRGALIWNYVDAIREMQPLFFVLENVPGLIAANHRAALVRLFSKLTSSGYRVSYGVLDAKDYGVAQSRRRVFFVGYRNDLKGFFSAPPSDGKMVNLGEALTGLPSGFAVPLKAADRNFSETEPFQANHYLDQDHYSFIYMSRNRVRKLSDFAFTVQASGQHAQIHPSAPRMEFVEKDVYRFKPGLEKLYRRISIRESARIQSFPDGYHFLYTSVAKGYKMVGNAVPVNLGKSVASQIKLDLTGDNHSSETYGSGNLLRFDDFRNSLPFALSA